MNSSERTATTSAQRSGSNSPLDMASPPPSPSPSEKEALLTNEMESVDFASLLADLESMPHTNINAMPIGHAGSRKAR